MNEASSTAFADPELAELLADEPELMAIADAIVATRPLVSDRRVASPPRGRPGRLRLPRSRTRSALSVAAGLAVVAAAPTIALSATVRAFLGIGAERSAPAPRLVATVTGVTVERRRVGEMVTVTFTVGAPAKPPGTAIPNGSVFLVSVLPRHGRPTALTKASGARGRYAATVWVPRGPLRAIQVGAWLNRLPTATAAGGFWLPVVVRDRGS